MDQALILRKVIGVPLEKAMAADDGNLLVRGKFTSDNKDEVGDIITRSATERAVPKYKRWGNIRRMHLPEPVGRVVRIGVEDGLDWNEVEIKVIDPKAKFEVEQGLLQALSVGILMAWEDIDVLEDGGWVINDYTLAEISLVDHPANYDAALELNMSMNEALRAQARELGLIPALRSMGIHPTTKGVAMEGEIETTEPVAEEVVESTAALEEEQPVATEEPAQEAAAPAEEPAEEIIEVPATQANEAPSFEQLFSSLSAAITELTARVDKMIEHREVPAQETSPEGDETAKGAGVADPRVAELEAEVAALKTQVEELTLPKDRKGALPVEEPVVEQTQSPAEEEKVVSLRDAVRKHLEARGRK